MHDVEVLFEDKDLLVLVKPSGLIVNRSDTTGNVPTLQDFVEKQTKINYFTSSRKGSDSSYETPEEMFAKRSGIVHRLDKETSGIMLVAKNLETFIDLQKQFKERVVQKTYLALSHGKIVPEEGEISVPVGRLNYNRMRFGVVAGGRESITKYKVLHYYTNPKTKETLSFVELYPKTGRTHQIRVHLQYLGHPIFGDELYVGRKVSREDRKVLPRVFLHASQITFLHPTNHKEMHFKALLSKELQEVLDQLQ